MCRHRRWERGKRGAWPGPFFCWGMSGGGGGEGEAHPDGERRGDPDANTPSLIILNLGKKKRWIPLPSTRGRKGKGKQLEKNHTEGGKDSNRSFLFIHREGGRKGETVTLHWKGGGKKKTLLKKKTDDRLAKIAFLTIFGQGMTLIPLLNARRPGRRGLGTGQGAN